MTLKIGTRASTLAIQQTAIFIEKIKKKIWQQK